MSYEQQAECIRHPHAQWGAGPEPERLAKKRLACFNALVKLAKRADKAAAGPVPELAAAAAKAYNDDLAARQDVISKYVKHELDVIEKQQAAAAAAAAAPTPAGPPRPIPKPRKMPINRPLDKLPVGQFMDQHLAAKWNAKALEALHSGHSKIDAYKVGYVAVIAEMNRFYLHVTEGSQSVVYLKRSAITDGELEVHQHGLSELSKLRASLGKPGDLPSELEPSKSNERGVMTTHFIDSWMSSLHRRQSEGIVFSPPEHGEPADRFASHFNLWAGHAIPKGSGGNAAGMGARMFLDYVQQVFRPNADELRFLLSWMGLAIQFPGSRPQTLVAMLGKKGLGKSALPRILAEVLGQLYCAFPSKMDNLTGNHAAFDNTCLVFVDECLYLGDNRGQEVLKTLITEPTLLVDRKHIQAYTARNRLSIMLATNNRIPCKTSADSRRFFYLNAHRVPDPYRPDSKDNAHLVAPLFDQANLLDIAEYLHTYKIDHELLKQPPHNEALVEQKVLSMHGVERWIGDELAAGQLAKICQPDRTRDFPCNAAGEPLYDMYMQHCSEIKAKHVIKRSELRQQLCEVTGAKLVRLGAGGRDGMHIRMPSYPDILKHMATHYQTTPDVLERHLIGNVEVVDDVRTAPPMTTHQEKYADYVHEYALAEAAKQKAQSKRPIPRPRRQPAGPAEPAETQLDRILENSFDDM